MNTYFRRSIRVRLVLITGGICLLFFAGFALGTGETLRLRAEEAARAELERSSLLMATVLDESVYAHYRNIEIVSTLYSLRSDLFNGEEKRVVLESVQNVNPEFAWIGLTDADGVVLVSTGGLLEDMDVSTRPWFTGAREGPFFGDVHKTLLLDPLLLDPLLHPQGGEPLRFVDVAVPVYGLNGDFAGVLSAHLSWEWAAQVQRSIFLPFAHQSGLEAFILSSEGGILFSSATEMEMFDFSGITSASASPSRDPQTSSIVELIPGRSFLAVLTPSRGHREYPGLGWKVLVAQPTAEVYAVAREVQQTIFILGLGLGVLLVVILWYMAGRIVHPLASIVNAANRIREEEGNVSIPIIPGQDEVTSLSHSLHHLVSRLRTTVNRLQALHAIDRAIMQGSDISVALDVVVQETRRKLGVDAVDILLVDEESQELHYAAGTGFRTDSFQSAVIPVGTGLSGRVADKRETIVINDVSTTTELVDAEGFRAEGFMGYTGTPLVNQEQLVGILEVYQRQPLYPDDSWRDFLESLALQSAIAIQHARLFTETRRLLAQTERQAFELTQILESVPSGILLLDHERQIRHMNSIAREYMGELAQYDESESLRQLGNRALEELLAPVDPDKPDHEIVDDENARVYEVVAYRLVIASTPDHHWVMVIADVTAARARQQQMQRQERLATVGQLSAGIAHDFNNILTPIFIYGHMLTLHEQDEKMRVGTQNILKAANRAKELIAQILTFSRGRPEQGQKVLQLQPIIGEVLALLEAVLPASIVIHQQVQPQVAAIRGDTTQLHQVLMNLCTNAYQAMPHGGELTIGLEAVTAEQVLSNGADPEHVRPDLRQGPYAHLTVADTGVGMDPATLARVFEPFFSTKVLGEGTGMGLAMVHNIIKEYEGFIGVESEPREGTLFHIYLPIVVDETTLDTQAAAAFDGERKDANLLIVDDEVTILAALKEALESYGYTVTTIAFSQDALAAISESPHAYDLIITDLNMPGLAGDELVRTIRRIGLEIPVLLMSGSNRLLSDAQIQNLQATGSVSKPFTIQELIQAIESMLTEKGDS